VGSCRKQRREGLEDRSFTSSKLELGAYRFSVCNTRGRRITKYGLNCRCVSAFRTNLFATSSLLFNKYACQANLKSMKKSLSIYLCQRQLPVICYIVLYFDTVETVPLYHPHVRVFRDPDSLLSMWNIG
jgi:hypothetical protein